MSIHFQMCVWAHDDRIMQNDRESNVGNVDTFMINECFINDCVINLSFRKDKPLTRYLFGGDPVQNFIF